MAGRAKAGTPPKRPRRPEPGLQPSGRLPGSRLPLGRSPHCCAGHGDFRAGRKFALSLGAAEGSPIVWARSSFSKVRPISKSSRYGGCAAVRQTDGERRPRHAGFDARGDARLARAFSGRTPTAGARRSQPAAVFGVEVDRSGIGLGPTPSSATWLWRVAGRETGLIEEIPLCAASLPESRIGPAGGS